MILEAELQLHAEDEEATVYSITQKFIMLSGHFTEFTANMYIHASADY